MKNSNMHSARRRRFPEGIPIFPRAETTPSSKTCFPGATRDSTSISAEGFGPRTKTPSAILPSASFEPVSPGSAWLRIPAEKSPAAPPRSSAIRRTEGPNKPSTPSTGSRGSSFVYLINTSSQSAMWVLFQQVPRQAKKGGNRRHRAVDRARRNDVETVPPQPGEACSKNPRGRSAPLSQLRASNADRIDPRVRPDRRKDPGAPRSMGRPKPRPSLRKRFPYPKNSSATIRTPESRDTTIGTESLSDRKKPKSGISAGLLPETGRFPCFPGCFRLSANHFQPVCNLSPFPFRFDDHPGEQLKNPLYFR